MITINASIVTHLDTDLVSSTESLPIVSCNDNVQFKHNLKGPLGGSVGGASDFGSGHDLTVRGFRPHIRLCAEHLLRAWSLLWILCLPLTDPPLFTLCLSLSQK